MGTPSTLAHVAEARTDIEFVLLLKEFIDHVLAHARGQGHTGRGRLPLPEDALMPPASPAPSPTTHAYLCAMGEHLAWLSGVPAPAWTSDPKGFLDEPVFQGGPHAREFMLKDTPPAFRRRLLFVGPVLLKLDLLRQGEA